MAKKNKKPEKRFNQKNTIVIICTTIIAILCLFLVFISINQHSALYPDELKNFQSEIVNKKSLKSEFELKNEVNKLALEENGLTEVGSTYNDYCEQDNEGGTVLNDYFVKTCSQKLVLYVSSIYDVKSVNEQLTNIFQRNNRFIATYPPSGACMAGQSTLLRDAKISYSKNGDLAINNQISGGFTILPVDKTQRDKTCETRIQGIHPERLGWQWEAGRYFIKSSTLDENNIQNTIEAKSANTLIILVFGRTYYKEAI